MSLVRVLHLLDSSGSLQLERWAKKKWFRIVRSAHPTKVYSDDQAHRHPLRSQRNRIHDPHYSTRNLESPWRSNPNPRSAYAMDFPPLFAGLIAMQPELSKALTTVGVEGVRSSQACSSPPPQNHITHLLLLPKQSLGHATSSSSSWMYSNPSATRK